MTPKDLTDTQLVVLFIDVVDELIERKGAASVASIIRALVGLVRCDDTMH